MNTKILLTLYEQSYCSVSILKNYTLIDKIYKIILITRINPKLLIHCAEQQ